MASGSDGIGAHRVITRRGAPETTAKYLQCIPAEYGAAPGAALHVGARRASPRAESQWRVEMIPLQRGAAWSATALPRCTVARSEQGARRSWLPRPSGRCLASTQI